MLSACFLPPAVTETLKIRAHPPPIFSATAAFPSPLPRIGGGGVPAVSPCARRLVFPGGAKCDSGGTRTHNL